jgi:hypothetical protein
MTIYRKKPKTIDQLTFYKGFRSKSTKLWLVLVLDLSCVQNALYLMTLSVYLLELWSHRLEMQSKWNPSEHSMLHIIIFLPRK